MIGGKVVVRWPLGRLAPKSESVDFWNLAREHLCHGRAKIKPKKVPSKCMY